MKKAKQRQIFDINNAPLTSMELTAIAKERLKPKSNKLDKLSKGKCGLELAGLQPCRWGDHDKNFGKKSLNMYE